MKTADLERSKRLKELGWEQGVDSSYWVVEIENPDYFWIEQDKSSESGLYNNYCAPTASEADIIVAHNGNSFDFKWLNYIFLKHGLDPVPPYKTVDTLQVARGNFYFTSNKLDFISQRLGVGAKVKHEGFGLWTKCMAGDDDAWKRMEKYNKGDVLVLEGVYKKLRPFMKKHPRIINGEGIKCPVCGSFNLQANGFLTNLTGRFQRYKCLDCRRWTHDKKPTERFNHALV